MKFSAVFKAISEDTRLRIINLILAAGRPLCVCEIVDTLGLPQYLVSRHLLILKNLGLIKSKKTGRWVYYSSNAQKSAFLPELFAVVQKHLTGRIFRADVKKLQAKLRKPNNDKCGSRI